MSGMDRILLRLEDGHVVYQLHPRVTAVILTDAECRLVEKLVLMRTLTVVGIIVALLVLFLLALAEVLPVLPAAVLAAAVFSISFVVDAKFDAAGVVRQAPHAPDRFQPKTKPTWLDVVRMIGRQTLQEAPNFTIWTFIVCFAVTLFGALRMVWMQIDGSGPTVPDKHPVALLFYALLSALGLRIFLRERARRRRLKRTDPGQRGGESDN